MPASFAGGGWDLGPPNDQSNLKSPLPLIQSWISKSIVYRQHLFR